MEIEKKYRLKYWPENLERYPKKIIEQGYLCENPVIRIRKSNEDFILTYKSRFGFDENRKESAKVCNETEVALTRESYEHLKTKIDWNMIEKTRYLIPVNEKHTAELDVFRGRLEGLFFAEVEFESEEEAEVFIPPEWFGEEVTHDERYLNKNLAKVDSFSEMKYN